MPRRHLLLPALLATIAACAAEPDSPTAVAHAGHDADASTRRAYEAVTQGHLNAAARVREATAMFRDPQAAVDAGYAAQFPDGCAKLEDGSAAQGFHYLNPTLAGDAKLDLLRPELVMYEPQADGSLVLVGVDYVIPFALWDKPQPPVLLGMPMMRNEGLEVWALHIWTERANPAGLFAAWNPNVSCAYEAIADLPVLPGA